MSLVLVVGDGLTLTRTVAVTLRALGYQVHSVSNEAGALRELERFRPGVIVLDLGVPGLGGADVLTHLRRSSKAPMIVLSNQSTAEEEAMAIEAGADDYLAKPFRMREMLSVVRAAAQLATIPVEGPSLVVTEHFTIDFGDGRVTRDGQLVRLTPTQSRLAARMIRQEGTVVAAERLLADVWGPAFSGDTSLLRAGVAQLRGKLEPDPSHPRYFITEAGRGYRFQR